jgi:hypothetical protein
MFSVGAILAACDVMKSPIISKKSWANLPCFPCYPEGGIIWDNLEEDLRAITSRLSHQSPDLPSLEHCHACGLTHNAIVDSLQ